MTKKKTTTNITVPYRGMAMAKANKVRKKRSKASSDVSQLGKMFRALGGGVGTLAGGYLGYPTVGGQIGTSLGAAMSKWLGSGDYRVAQNSVLSTGDIPAMHNDGQSIIVRHKEFVTELTSSTSFQVRKALPLNPGLPGSFPWLSTVARNYLEYKIKGMVFHYVPTSGNAVGSTNTALGSVMFQTTYRASDVAPTSKVEMLNEYCANECVPSDTVCHPIECDPKENPFQVQYTRNTAVPSGDSTLLYDLGTTYIAVTGQQANDVVLGDVWVTYEVELKKPVVITNSIAGESFFGQTLTTASYLFAGVPGSTLLTSPGLSIESLSNTAKFNAVAGRYYTVFVACRTSGAYVQAGAITYSITSGGVTATGPYASVNGESITGTTTLGVTRWFTLKATASTVVLSFNPPSISTGGYENCTISITSYS